MARVGKRGKLTPMHQPMWGGALLTWATDMAVADKEALGLTSVRSPCDRSQFRYRILDTTDFVWFPDWLPQAMPRLDPGHVSLLTLPPIDPRHWWVSDTPTVVRLG